MLMLMFMLLPLHFLSQSRSNRKSSNTLCFRIFFASLGTNNTVNTIFLHLGNPKPLYLR